MVELLHELPVTHDFVDLLAIEVIIMSVDHLAKLAQDVALPEHLRFVPLELNLFLAALMSFQG